MSEFFNIDNSRSYATEANLMKGLDKLGLAKGRPLVVLNRAGRYTAIFQNFHLNIANISVPGVCVAGFKVMG